MALDSYSVSETTRLIARHRHPGPWNAKWVPTPVQLKAYVAAVRTSHDASSTTSISLNAGTNR